MWELRGDGCNKPEFDWMKSIATATEGQAKVLNKAQHEFLDSYKNVVDHWCQRRHEGVAALMSLTRDVTEARSPTAVGTAVLRWYQGALQRLSLKISPRRAGGNRRNCCARSPIMADARHAATMRLIGLLARRLTEPAAVAAYDVVARGSTMDTPPLDEPDPLVAMFARIAELSAESCALLLTRHGFEVVGERDVNVLRNGVAEGYRVGRIPPDKIMMEWLYDQGWQPLESVDFGDDEFEFDFKDDERPAS